MHHGTDMNASHFGVKRSKVKVTMEQSMLEKQHFLGLLTRYLEKYELWWQR